MRLCENSRSASALATFFPRINCATRLSFCGEIRSILLTAFASFSLRSRSRWRLPMSLLFYLSARRCSGSRCRRSGARRSRRGCALSFAIGRVAVEHPGRRKLAELVTDHFLVHQHRNVLLAVIDAEIQPDELRENGRAPAPDLDHLVTAGRARGLCLAQQVTVDKRTFPNRTRHRLCPYCCFFLRSCRLVMMKRSVRLFLRLFLPLVGKPHGVV